MTSVDVVATGAAFAASAFLGLRAYILKPAFSSWCTAPARVWIALLILSVACAIVGLSIVLGHGHADALLMLVLLALAYASGVLLENLHAQGPAVGSTSAQQAER